MHIIAAFCAPFPGSESRGTALGWEQPSLRGDRGELSWHSCPGLWGWQSSRCLPLAGCLLVPPWHSCFCFLSHSVLINGLFFSCFYTAPPFLYFALFRLAVPATRSSLPVLFSTLQIREFLLQTICEISVAHSSTPMLWSRNTASQSSVLKSVWCIFSQFEPKKLRVQLCSSHFLEQWSHATLTRKFSHKARHGNEGRAGPSPPSWWLNNISSELLLLQNSSFLITNISVSHKSESK